MATCRDFRDRLIRFDESYWEHHVVRMRPFMAGHERSVFDVLRSPQAPSLDRNVDYRECFYGPAPDVFDDCLLKVVVQFDENNVGIFITAFLCSRIYPEERIVWTQLESN